MITNRRTKRKSKNMDVSLNFSNDGTDNEGASPLIIPGKDENTKRQKIKNNPEEKASASSPLNGFIRGPQYLKAFGFPIENFRHEGRGKPLTGEG